MELIPEMQLDPLANSTPYSRTNNAVSSQLVEDRPVAKILYEIPSLKGIAVAQAVAGDRTSYVLTKESGRVLAWGANEYG